MPEVLVLYLYNNGGRTSMLAIRLPPEIEARLNALSRSTGRTKSFYVREAILEHLGDLEDLYIAEKRLIEHRAGRKRTIPLAALLKRYGMADRVQARRKTRAP